jgi:thiamine biosynthesis lipoprotein
MHAFPVPRLTFLLVCAALAAPAAAAPPQPSALFGPTMGTSYTVKIAQPLDAEAKTELARAIDAALDDVNGKMSTYLDDSELSRFNASTSTDWFDVSPETATVVQRALEVAKLSGGAFDPTVAPLIRMWHFDRDKGKPDVPSDEAIANALKSVGYEKVQVRMDPPALRKSIPETELNLSAIAKGYAVDQVARLLEGRKIANYMVEIGGEIRTGGRKQDGSSWKIGVERPDDNERLLQAALPLDDASVATSGDYRNFFEVDGVRYSHTIDPATGRPVRHDMASVTVIADDCMSADAFATALNVLGPERGLELAEREGIAAWMLVREGDSVRAIASPAFVSGPGKELKNLAAEAKPEDQSAWTTMLIAAGVFGIAMVGLAAGLILRGKHLAGTCGGLNNMRDSQGRPMCSSCSIPPEQCDEFRRAAVRQQEPAEPASH